MKITSVVALVVSFVSLTACDKTRTESVPMSNELRAPVVAPPAKTVARGGVADDGVKPVPVSSRGGVPDDSIKPLPLNQRGGIPDDGIKPLPMKERGGIPDDSIKPVPKR